MSTVILLLRLLPLALVGMASCGLLSLAGDERNHFYEGLDGSGRDAEVTKRIDDVRLVVLSDPAKKLHFQRSVTRFCRVQVSRTIGQELFSCLFLPRFRYLICSCHSRSQYLTTPLPDQDEAEDQLTLDETRDVVQECNNDLLQNIIRELQQRGEKGITEEAIRNQGGGGLESRGHKPHLNVPCGHLPHLTTSPGHGGTGGTGRRGVECGVREL